MHLNILPGAAVRFEVYPLRSNPLTASIQCSQQLFLLFAQNALLALPCKGQNWLSNSFWTLVDWHSSQVIPRQWCSSLLEGRRSSKEEMAWLQAMWIHPIFQKLWQKFTQKNFSMRKKPMQCKQPASPKPYCSEAIEVHNLSLCSIV